MREKYEKNQIKILFFKELMTKNFAVSNCTKFVTRVWKNPALR